MLLPLARSLGPLGYTRAAAPAPYSPADEGNLILWLDTPEYGSAYYQDSAMTTPATADGDPVGAWTGAGGTTIKATQATSSLRATLRKGANGIGGLDALEFAGDYLNSDSFLDSTYNTGITILSVNSAGTLTALRIYAANVDTRLYLGRDNVPQSYFYTNNVTADKQLNVGMSTGAHVEAYRYNGSTKLGAVDGGAYVSESVTGNLGLSGVLRIGAFPGSTTFDWQGKVAALLIYKGALSTAAMARVREWLMDRFSLRPSNRLVAAGDSLTRGFGLASPSTQSYPAQTITELSGLGYTYALSNLGVDSRTLATMVTQAASEVDPLYDTFRALNIAILWGGTNDLQFSTSVTAADLLADYEEWGDGRIAAGFERVILLDMIPRTDAGTGQATHETRRQAFNALLAADFSVATANPLVWLPGPGVTYGSALVKLSAITELQDTNDLTYYQNDDVHLNATGAGLVADAVAAAVEIIQ